MRFKPEIYTSISSAGTSSSRLCLAFVDGDRIKIIPFACANNSVCVHVGVKIALTMEQAALPPSVVVVTQDEKEEEEEERDEMLINGPDRLALCLLFFFVFLFLLFLLQLLRRLFLYSIII